MTDRTPMQRALDAEAKVTDLARRVEVLEGALLAVKQRSREVHDLYNKNGPQWTSRSTGHEYADMSYVLEIADEYEAIADAALSGKDRT